MLKRRVVTKILLQAGGSAILPSFEAEASPKPLVMIDPGHGGHDPGCLGAAGAREKTIALLVGFDLRRALLDTRRCRVGMTRVTDQFVPLTERVAIAIRARASLFISLHCNHLDNPAVRGASIFSLSQRPSDALAAAIANKENSYDAPPHRQFCGVSPDVANILASLETRATRIGYKRLAEELVSAFPGHVSLLPNPDRSANFAVLRDGRVPSNLIEIGCLSNPQDAHLLQTVAHRKLLASRIAAATENWFSHNDFERIAG